MGITSLGQTVIRKCTKLSTISPDLHKSGKIANQLTEAVPDRITNKFQRIMSEFTAIQREEKFFYKSLYDISPEKFDILTTHSAFDGSYPCFAADELLKAVKKMSPEEIQKTLSEITDFYKKLPPELKLNQLTNKLIEVEHHTPNAIEMAQLTILKANKPNTYQYIMKNPDKKTESLLRTFSMNYNGSVFETLTPEQIRQITYKSAKNIGEPIYTKGALKDYVECSDSFYDKPEQVKTLHDILSKCSTTETFTAYRGERDTGMFNCILVDKTLAKKAKYYILKNFYKTKKITAYEYTGKYDKFFEKKQSLFDYILHKQDLSLADVMQVAKYGNKNFQTEILEYIKQAQIKDSRFKSITFDRSMASNWAGTQNSTKTTILQNMTIKEGTNGVKSHVSNRQAEYILSDNDKRLTFQNAKYNPETDTFEIDSTIENW